MTSWRCFEETLARSERFPLRLLEQERVPWYLVRRSETTQRSQTSRQQSEELQTGLRLLKEYLKSGYG